MSNIFIVGYYGADNAGDEILMASSVSILRTVFPHHDIDVRTVNMSLGQTIRQVLGSQKIVLGGGSLLQDKTSFWSLMYYLGILSLAQLLGKQTYLLAQGMGPFRYSISRWLTSMILRRCTRISTRDHASTQYLEGLKVSPYRIIEGSDLGYWEATFSPPPFHNPTSRIMVSLMSGYEGILEKMGISDALNRYNRIDELIAHPRQDKGCVSELGITVSESVDLEHVWHDCPHDVSAVVSMRYHACVWASLHGRPFFALAHDPKLKQLAIDLKQPYIDMTSNGLVNFQEEFDRFLDRYDFHANALSTFVPDMIRKAKVHEEMFFDRYPTVDVCGYAVTPLSLTSIKTELNGMLKSDRFCRITTLNPQIIVESKKDHDLRRFISNSDLIFPESEGVRWALRREYDMQIPKVAGVELAEELLQSSYRVFLLGATPEVMDLLIKQCKKRPCKIVGYHHGFFDDLPAVISMIKKSEPDVVLVGMGFPRQETVLKEISSELQRGVGIGVGGSFDVISGYKKRAPKLIRLLKMEWLYRGVSEPKRIMGWAFLPKFVGSVLESSRQK